MRLGVRRFIWLAAVLLVVAGAPVPASAAANCAFQDVNDNGLFDAGDVIVADAAWIGATFTSIHPFVVPSGCDHTLATPPGLTRVIATKITVLGSLEILVKTGAPIVLEANPDAIVGAQKGDGSVKIQGATSVITKIKTGGTTGNLFPDFVAGNEAIHDRAITIIARGRTSPAAPGLCTFTSAEIDTIIPGGTNDIGVHCRGDVTFRNTKFTAARINVQSLAGAIDARSFGGTTGNALGNLCDDPTFNLTGNGNFDGIIDAGDFPCTLDLGGNYPGTTTFADAIALQGFCDINEPPGGFNSFLALNDPLTMIAQTVLDARGSGTPGLDTVLSGRYRVVLASVTSNLLLQNTQVNHAGGTPPGGAKIELSATPASVNRLQNDREDLFGPATGTIDITSACLSSGRRIFVSTGDTVIGAPEPPPCAQFPADFTFSLNLLN
jgi:hypothetical protein